MHHKRTKMKPEEELPSPGAVSIQVRKVDMKKISAISFNTGYSSPMPMLRFRSGGFASQVLASPVNAGHPPVAATIGKITNRCLHLSTSIWMCLILRCAQRKRAHPSTFR